MSQRDDSIICLFDVRSGDSESIEGLTNRSPHCLFALASHLQGVKDDVLDMLKHLRSKVVVGVVGGSDFAKQKHQLGENVLDLVDYSFSENGLVGYKGHELIHQKSIKDELGDERIKKFVNFVLRYIADLDIPVKRGTFVEFRTGLINVSPIGRNCSQEERIAFNEYDAEHKIREKFVAVLQKEFQDFNLQFSIGGQISFDVFPTGWDKTYCLQHLEGENFKEIHFFGDKTQKGGNDHEIFVHESTVGHHVDSPEDTIRICRETWLQ